MNSKGVVNLKMPSHAAHIIFFSIVGSILNISSYSSVSPLILVLVLLTALNFLLIFTPLGGNPELIAFNYIFSICWMMSGIAAIYANQFGDESQLFSDAGGFYLLSSSGNEWQGLNEIREISEGSLAIYIWSYFYDFLYMIGFERGRYIGVYLNICAVSLSGLIGIKLIRLIYGNDLYRFNKFKLIMGWCGIFWLFASIHLRDSLVLLSVTSLLYPWLKFLRNPDFGFNFLLIFLVSVTVSYLLFFLRGEFIFVPPAIVLAGILSMTYGYQGRKQKRNLIYVLIFFGILLAAVAFYNYYDTVITMLKSSQEGYFSVARDSSQNSLAMRLIIDQPLPIRIIFGSVYLFVFPIPFWVGFQTESAYSLFKSLYVLYLYALVPMLFVSLRTIIKNKFTRTPQILFLLLISIGFLIGCAVTSLETRHYGAFFIAVIIFSITTDMRNSYNWNLYKLAAQGFIIFIMIVHVAWILLKS